MKGFTLIELIIILAIIGILSAIALPAYKKHVDEQNGVIVEYNTSSSDEPIVQ